MSTAAITTIGVASRARAPALVLFRNIGSPRDGELGVRLAAGPSRVGGPRRAAVWDPGPIDQPRAAGSSAALLARVVTGGSLWPRRPRRSAGRAAGRGA